MSCNDERSYRIYGLCGESFTPDCTGGRNLYSFTGRFNPSEWNAGMSGNSDDGRRSGGNRDHCSSVDGCLCGCFICYQWDEA